MLLKDFHEWRCDPRNHSIFESEISKDNFDVFFQYWSGGKTFMHLLGELSFQIYELQECMEGIIEDCAG